jgi:AcrR family transcriptional regulator
MIKAISRREIILQEAAHLFREKSYPGSNLRELAKRAGIQGGSIYHHFSSKQEILFQLMDHTMEDMFKQLSALLAPCSCPAERLRQSIRFHIAYNISGPDETYITDDELRNLDTDNYRHIIAKRDLYQRLFEETIATGNEEQNWNVDNTKLVARAIIQMCSGVSRWYKPGGEFNIDQIADQYFTLLTAGLISKK